MKKILIILLSIFIVCACDKEEADNTYFKILQGDWHYSKLSTSLNFSSYDKGKENNIIKFHNNNCQAIILINDEEVITIGEFSINSNKIKITKGKLTIWDNGFVLKTEEIIEIIDFSNSRIVLKWKNKENDQTYYTELKRIEPVSIN